MLGILVAVLVVVPVVYVLLDRLQVRVQRAVRRGAALVRAPGAVAAERGGGDSGS